MSKKIEVTKMNINRNSISFSVILEFTDNNKFVGDNIIIFKDCIFYKMLIFILFDNQGSPIKSLLYSQVFR